MCGVVPGQLCLAQNKEVVSAKETLSDAFHARDTDGIRDLLLPGNIAVTPRLQTYTRAQLLEQFPELKIESYDMSDMSTTPVADGVIALTFKCDIVGTYQGKQLAPLVRVVETWIKLDGKWQQATYQETQVDEQ